MLSATALPYGYSVTLWASGAMVAARHGLPRAEQVWLFVLGAPAAFATVVLLRGMGAPLRDVGSPRAGIIQVVAIGASVGAAGLAARAASPWAWPLASFGATAAFLTISSAGLMLIAAVEGLRPRASGLPRIREPPVPERD